MVLPSLPSFSTPAFRHNVNIDDICIGILLIRSPWSSYCWDSWHAANFQILGGRTRRDSTGWHGTVKVNRETGRDSTGWHGTVKLDRGTRHVSIGWHGRDSKRHRHKPSRNSKDFTGPRDVN
jgi:hypothetical protein